MAIKLRQSTASQEVALGPFLDSTNGNDTETALTILNTDIKLWKMGATTLANKNSGGATHISQGVYYAVLDATDTNTLGAMVIFVHVTGALAVRVECEVLSANVYDSLIAGTDVLNADVTQINGATAPVTNLEDDYDGTGYVKANSTVGTVTANTDMRGTDSAALASVCTEARLAELDAANIPTDLATIAGYIDTEISDIITHLTDIKGAGWTNENLTTIDGLIDTLLTRLTVARAGYLDNLNGHTPQTGDSFARLGAPAGASVSADLLVIDNFVDELESRLTAVRAANLDNLDAAISSLNDLSAAQVNAEVVDALTVDTIAELTQGIPTATPTIASGLMLLYMALRNRADQDTVSGFKEFYNDAGVVIWKKATSDAGGIYSDAEGQGGP